MLNIATEKETAAASVDDEVQLNSNKRKAAAAKGQNKREKVCKRT